MIRFVDEHKDRFGVEPLIGVLRGTDAGFLSVSGYYAAKTRPPSIRSIADAGLCEQISAVHRANYSVYGVRKMHDALHRAGVPIGRDHLARLMRQLGLAGARRGRPKRTTIADSAAARPADLVRRKFHAVRPNQLWVCDMTYIRTWVGFAYLALVIDVHSRQLVGWALTTHMRTDLPLEALQMAISARHERLDGLIHHSDAGSNTPRSATPTPSPAPGLWLRSARSATATTTPSPNPPSARSRPNSSTSTALGAPLSSWNTPCSSTSTGGTTAVCTPRSACAPQPKQRPPTTLKPCL
jgi:transposase InsO family protein